MRIFAAEMTEPSYLHPLEWQGEALPTAFTYPFRYTPHPLCVRAAAIVQEQLKLMGIAEGKMYGVMIVKARTTKGEQGEGLSFLAAYSGQLQQSYHHPWFVPPIVDYLDPDGYFQQEQAKIVEMGQRLEALRESEERKEWQTRVQQLTAERDQAVAKAKAESEAQKRHTPLSTSPSSTEEESGVRPKEGEDYIRLRQYLKANIHRAKQLHKEEITDLEARLADHNIAIHDLYEERKRRSEALQQWLFEQFVFLNGQGEKKELIEIFSPTPNRSCHGGEAAPIPSGAGECCAPKLLQAAYQLGLEPLAMAEFWWGPSKPGHYKQPGAFFPACHSKCRPILGFMLQGLNVEADPALHYEQALKPVRVVWEDEYLAVIEKPEGWCSIPGKSDQANLFDEALRLWPDIEGSIIVHRLDQDTSGVMVIAKTARIHRALSQQFERREVEKRYVALLEKRPTPDPSREGRGEAGGSIQLPIGPDLDNMPHQQVDWENGKEAITHFYIIGTEERASTTVTRVVFHPQTGRTHQLRVHSAAPEGLNTPILGDRLYGHVSDRLYLHAEAIDFTHPLTHEHLHFEIPCPF